MLQPTPLVLDNTAAVPTQVAAAGSDNAQGTPEHAHNPRAHACVPAPLPTCPLLVEDDQEHRAHDPTVKTLTVGTTVTNQLSDKKLEPKLLLLGLRAEWATTPPLTGTV